jgi:hypothetical protein
MQNFSSIKNLKKFAINYYEPLKKGGGIDILTAFHQLTKSVDFMMTKDDEFTSLFLKTMPNQPNHPLFIHYPIIVFDGHMFEYIIEDDDCQLKRRENLTYHLCQNNFYFIDIVEKAYFANFLEQIDKEFSDLICNLGK